MEFYIAERKKELIPFATAWMELESIMLSEIDLAMLIPSSIDGCLGCSTVWLLWIMLLWTEVTNTCSSPCSQFFSLLQPDPSSSQSTLKMHFGSIISFLAVLPSVRWPPPPPTEPLLTWRKHQLSPTCPSIAPLGQSCPQLFFGFFFNLTLEPNWAFQKAILIISPAVLNSPMAPNSPWDTNPNKVLHDLALLAFPDLPYQHFPSGILCWNKWLLMP